MQTRWILFLALSFVVLGMYSQERTNPLNQDEELGKVSWLRDFNAAVKLSEKENKPILILFQEVPGCATCRNYGHNVLSHPLMTEVIENEFIPLAIFNNRKGKDLEVLKKYNEPTWNNPVVRIVDKNGKNIVKRLASDYSAKGLYLQIIEALQIANKPIPEYVKILGSELSTTVKDHHLEEAYFEMYCFWTGEKELGAQDGVLATKAGFMNSAEVVKVIYNADQISEETLNTFATSNKMKPVKQGKFAWAEKDEDYFIQHSRFKYLPLTEVQKTKINSALGLKQSPLTYLSPKQQHWFKDLETSSMEVLYNKDFFASWDQLNRSQSN